MSYRLDLDEMTEHNLRTELRNRYIDQALGNCDYCHKPLGCEPSCKFPDRHNAFPRSSAVSSPGVFRLIQMLRNRPDVFAEVLQAMRTPVLTCEGDNGPCEDLVLWPTPGMTSYPWNGEGEDPNRARMLCPVCSQAYTDHWQEEWDEYNSGRL